MKTFLHLWRRELADQRYFFVAALVTGTLPYLLAALSPVPDNEIADLRTASARAAVVLFFLVAPIALGARWLVAGFADRRRSFELARPLSAWQLCASKLAAILTIVLGGTWLASLPTLMSAFRFDTAALDAWLFRTLSAEPFAEPWTHYQFFLPGYGPAGLGWLVFLLLAAAGLAFVVLAILAPVQSLSLVFAERSWRSLVDLGAWLVFAALLAAAADRLRSYAAFGIALSWLAPLLLSICVLGVVGAWLSFRGGALIERAHGRHSLAMNLGLVALGSLAAISAYAATRPDIEKLSSYPFSFPSDDQSHWLIAGTQDPRGFEPAFLVETATGKATYLAPFAHLAGVPRFSADGRRLFMARFAEGRSKESFYLENGVQVSLPGEIGWGLGYQAELDGEGKLLVNMEKNFQVGVYELPGGRRRGLLKIPVDQGWSQVVHRHGTSFDVLVTLRGRKGGEIETRRFRLDAGSLTLEAGETWRFPSDIQPNAYDLETWWNEALPLLDAGMPFEKLARSPRLTALEGGFGVVVAAITETPPHAGYRFTIVSPRGEDAGSFEALPRGYPAGEIRPGLLLVGLHRKPDSFEYFIGARGGRLWGLSPNPPLATLVVEVPSGKILRRLEGLTPRKYAAASSRVWLENADGEPYDLAAADAEPQRILPFRPRLAKR